jgi:hypothetical protein
MGDAAQKGPSGNVTGNRRVTLDKPERYYITVQGRLSEHSSPLRSIRFTVYRYCGETTTLVGTVDQAELHGTLRSLYNMGLPIISVICDRAK